MTRLAALGWSEAGRLAADGAILVVPVGATEQHGPHLPLSTDTDIAVALVTAAAADCPAVVSAPAIAYGSSGEHQAFAGTISIGQAATELLLLELCRSATATFDRILLVSSHGGNAAPVSRAVKVLREEGRDVRAWEPRWDGDAHAGRVETSLMLAIHPREVRSAAAQRGVVTPVAELLPQLRRGGVRAVSTNGILGDPNGATAREGRELLKIAGRQLRGLIDAWTAPA